MTTSSDQLHRFIFDDADIRGEIVTLEQSLQDILSIHQYPAHINQLLGEFLAAANLLSRTLKFDGSLTLQARGDGDLSLIMAEVNHQKKIRGVVQLNQDATNVTEKKSLKELLGNGMLSITIDPDKGERYQGIVALEGENLAEYLEAYFMQSEQLPTRIWLHSNEKKSAGMLLQRLPQQIANAEENGDAWETQTHLASTISSDELLNLTHEEILIRLFHETGVRVFDPESIIFSCSCSRERTNNTLQRLGQKELQTIIDEDGEVCVDCHFCGYKYIYTQEHTDALFSPETRH